MLEAKKKIIGKCELCRNSISDPIYSFELIYRELSKYIHFECALKLAKQKSIEHNPKKKNIIAVYIGKGCFITTENKKLNHKQYVDISNPIYKYNLYDMKDTLFTKLYDS